MLLLTRGHPAGRLWPTHPPTHPPPDCSSMWGAGPPTPPSGLASRVRPRSSTMCRVAPQRGGCPGHPVRPRSCGTAANPSGAWGRSPHRTKLRGRAGGPEPRAARARPGWGRGGRSPPETTRARPRGFRRAADPAGAWGRSPHRKKLRGRAGGPEPRAARSPPGWGRGGRSPPETTRARPRGFRRAANPPGAWGLRPHRTKLRGRVGGESRAQRALSALRSSDDEGLGGALGGAEERRGDQAEEEHGEGGEAE